MNAQPHGNLTTRTLAMPADANPIGDIFGGWVMSQMDIAGGICSHERARCRSVTVAVDRMSFIEPVKVGDVLCVYTEVIRVGRTSMDIHVEAWTQKHDHPEALKVTEAVFKYVAIDKNGRPTPVSE